MKNVIRFMVLALSVSFLLSACGGGGGGGGSTSATAAFTRSFSPSVPTNGVSLPFLNQDAIDQTLYYASEVNGSGDINALRFRYNGALAADVTCPNTTIKLGHTNLTALGTTFASNVETGQGSLVTVLDNATVTIPASAGAAWFDIPLTTSFHYNGVDNLVVQIDHTTACSDIVGVTTAYAATNRQDQATATDATPGTADYNTTTGTVGIEQPFIQFVFAGGDDLAWYGNSSSNAYPFFGGVTNRTQMLHPASAISGSGPITGIGMVVGDTLTAGGAYTLTIKLGHSTLTSLTTNFAGNFSGSPVTVANNLTFTVPANVPAGTTLWLPVNGSFTYNGTDNLIVDIDVSAASANNTGWMTGTSSANVVRMIGASGGATGTHSDSMTCDTKFRFRGSTMDVMPGAAVNGSIQVLGDGQAGRIESLYEPVYLGTGGTINSVAVRLIAAPSAATLNNFKIYMGHAAGNQFALTDTYAGSMIGGGTLVYSGALNVPGTLKAGDWLTIPLQTSFVYDPAKSLAIYFGTDQASAVTAPVSTQQSTAQFPSHSMGANTNGPDTDNPAWLYSSLIHVRLGITK